MYSEQLESLIQSIIADGIITDKELEVLHKKAEAEGVDIDELDVYVDGLINQMFPKNVEHIEDDYNVNLFNRIREDEAIYDIYRTPYYFDERENKDDIDWNEGRYRIRLLHYRRDEQSDKQLIIILEDPNASKYHFPTWYFSDLIFETNHGNIELSKVYHIDKLCIEGHILRSALFEIDVATFKLLCQSSNIRIKTNYRYYEQGKSERSSGQTQEERFDELYRTLPTFQIYLQQFYHDVIDCTAFPNVKTDVKQIENALNASREQEEKKRKREDFIDDIIGFVVSTPLGRFLAMILILGLLFLFQGC